MKTTSLKSAAGAMLIAAASLTSFSAFACGPHRSVAPDRCGGGKRPSPLYVGLGGGWNLNSASAPQGLDVKPGSGYSAALQLRKKYCRGFSLESGLRYSTVNYKVDGFTFSTGKGITAPMAMNISYSTLEIPLLANIRLGGSCGLSYGLQLGGYGSRVISHNSTMPGTTEYGEPTSFKATPRDGISMGLTTGAYLEYNMCRNTSFRLAPAFNYNLRNPYPVTSEGKTNYNLGVGATFFYKIGSCHRTPVRPSCPSRS